MTRRGRLQVPLLAAVLLSAVAHAAVVLVAESREPVGASIGAAAPSASTMHARLALAASLPSPVASSAPATTTDTAPPARVARQRRSAAPAEAQAGLNPDIEATRSAAAFAEASDVAVDQGPKPLTYPVISLPSDDDPRRVGLVRLLLVVSSEGRVVKTVVAAATLSQDYVDRITESFEAVRFAPATAHGLPRASWYEVVVDLTFDPEARSSV